MPKTATKNYKIDIFKIANTHLNKKGIFHFRSMSDEEKKELSQKFFILMRYLSGTYSEMELQLVNKLVNPYVFSLNTRGSKDEAPHPELVWFLMCISSIQTRHQWIKKKTKPKLSLPIEIIKKYYGYSTKDAIEVLPILSDENIIYLAEEIGTDEKVIRELKKELKKR